jgi:hypothetical protein
VHSPSLDSLYAAFQPRSNRSYIPSSMIKNQLTRMLLARKKVCRECAVRLDRLCAKSSLFATSQKCFRAGVFWR